RQAGCSQPWSSTRRGSCGGHVTFRSPMPSLLWEHEPSTNFGREWKHDASYLREHDPTGPLAPSRRSARPRRGCPMPMVRPVLVTHVAATIGLFVALAIEGVALARLRRAMTYEQARDWAGLLLAPVGLPSFLVVLASGVYLAKTLGAWHLDWASV